MRFIVSMIMLFVVSSLAYAKEAQLNGEENACSFENGIAYRVGSSDYLHYFAYATEYGVLNGNDLYPKDIATIKELTCNAESRRLLVKIAREKGTIVEFRIENGAVISESISITKDEKWRSNCMHAESINEQKREKFCDCIRNHEDLEGIYNLELERRAVGDCVVGLSEEQ